MQMRNCISCGEWLTTEARKAAQATGGLCEKCELEGGHEETRMFVLQRFAADTPSRDQPATPSEGRVLPDPARAEEPKRDASLQAGRERAMWPKQIPTPPFPPLPAKAQARTVRPTRLRVVILYFCCRCDKRLSDADILYGRPRHEDGEIVTCNDCAQPGTAEPTQQTAARKKVNGKGMFGVFSEAKTCPRQNTGLG